jgi:hypothetical protein
MIEASAAQEHDMTHNRVTIHLGSQADGNATRDLLF